MRLNRLDLVRYGCFTGQSIDLIQPQGERADFHIIYGDNEAGKTTILNAYGDFLFGIDHSSVYAFQHQASMAVGAQMEIAGQRHEWVRLKKRDAKASLFDAQGRQADAGPLEAALSAMDRATYERMFLLDRNELEKGGEAILKSEGRLGELLFAATSGLSGITAGLDSLDQTIDSLFKPGARSSKHRLHALKAELDRLGEEQKSVDLPADEYARMRDDLAARQAAYEALRREEETLRQELDERTKQLGALPRWHRLMALRREMAQRENHPPPPEGWMPRADAMATEARLLDTQARSERGEIDRLQTLIAEIHVNDALLETGEKIDRLARLEESYRAAADGFPELRARIDQTRQGIAGLMARIGRQPDDNPAQLLLSAPLHAGLSDKLEQIEGLRAAHATAASERDEARAAVHTAEAALKELGPPIDAQAHGLLRENLEALRDAQARHETAIQTLADAKDSLSAMFDTLAPWRGDQNALTDLPVPSETELHSLSERLSEAQQRAQRASEQMQDAQRRLEQTRAAAQALTGSGQLVDAEHLSTARDRRDTAWRDHRTAILTVVAGGEPSTLAGTADRFEAQMARHDQLLASHAQQNEERARLRQISEDQARCEADLDHLRLRLEDAQAQQNEARASLAEIAKALGHDRETEADRLREWLVRREDTLAQGRRVDALQTALAARAQRLEAASERLGDLLAQVGIEPPAPDDADALLLRAEILRDQLSQLVGRREEAVKADREARGQLLRRERAFDKADRDLNQWQVDWDRLIGSCWLGKAAMPLAPNQVRVILSALGTLGDDLARLNELDGAARQMSDQITRFQALVDDACRASGLERGDDDADAAARRLQTALAEARTNLAARKASQAECDLARDRLRDAEAKQALLVAEQQDMFARYGVADLEALRAALKVGAERAAMAAQIAVLEDDLSTSLGLSDMAHVAETLAGTDEARLRSEIEDIRPRLELKSKEALDAYHAFQQAAGAFRAVSDDDRAAFAMQRRRDVLNEIEQVAERYLRLSLGTLAVNEALGIYRDRHRSDMLREAARFFIAMTGGRFADLRAQPGKKGEELIGIPAGGGSLVAAKMSEGTRHQLFLALRLAGYGEFVKDREPVPFLADDILASFDDKRAAAALSLLTQIAMKGQVIYLTHHAHLCAIARQTCGDDVKVHTLPA